MKLIKKSEPRELKTVQYFNLELQVPVETKYISVMDDGDIVAWMDIYEPWVEPCSFLDGGYTWMGEALEFDIGCVDLEGMDWKDTLKEV